MNFQHRGFRLFCDTELINRAFLWHSYFGRHEREMLISAKSISLLPKEQEIMSALEENIDRHVVRNQKRRNI